METSVKLRDVRAFCSVVDHGSITAAARAVGETKGAVSRRVARLEQHLRAALIHRVGGRAQPTAEGLAYRKTVGEALELLDAASDSLHDRDASPQGQLRITALPGIGTDVLATRLGQFLERYPKISLHVVLTQDVLSFRDDRIDFAFRAASGQLPDSGHIAHRLGLMAPTLAASPSYIARHGAPTEPAELHQHRMLIPPVRGGMMTLPLQPVGEPDRLQVVQLEGALVSYDLGLLREAAVAGGGIVPLLGANAAQIFESGELVPVLSGWEAAARGTVYMIHPGGPMSPKARAFRDFMKASFHGGMRPQL
ncbi:MAG: LysR family transcriptional regulator [Myxococcales bacterium]|nr:LysR family transcriptional regulator [Myxococcales bacterium]